VFRGKIKSISGGEAVISTNRSGDLLSQITPSQVGKMSVGDEAMMFIRPEALAIGEADPTAMTTITANVVHEEFECNSFSVFLDGDGGKQIKMAVPNLGQDRIATKGNDMSLHYDSTNAIIMPAGDLASE
jgi:spermidine/putrescine transport system ATP-binding protein